MNVKIEIEQTKATHEPYFDDGIKYEEGIFGFELSIKGIKCPNGDRTKLNLVSYALTEAIANTVVEFQKAINLGMEGLS